MCICVIHVFSGSGTSQSQGSNSKAVFDKVLNNYCSKKIVERFVLKNCVPKKNPIARACFINLIQMNEIGVLGLILSSYQYLRSAMLRFPLLNLFNIKSI